VSIMNGVPAKEDGPSPLGTTISADTVTDSITDNLLYILPLIHRRLLKVEFERVNPNLSRLHFVVLRILNDHSQLPISEIGKNLFIPKPQMTALVDKLIQFRLVARVPDTQDRRVININLTDAGRKALEECDRLIRDSIRQKLSSLSREDLESFLKCTTELRELGTKLE
jgi:DNA-binding MarR family transcriptional regulator